MLKNDTDKADIIKNNPPSELYRLLDSLFHHLRSRVSEEWMDVDLTMPQVRLLFALHRNGASRMSVIASLLDISLPNSTGLVDRLVEKNLVVRKTGTDDRRSVSCELSSAGQELVESLLYSRKSWWDSRLRELDEKEIQEALKGLSALITAIKRAD
jgi:DNA-binding MarR family transcriptional regulator